MGSPFFAERRVLIVEDDQYSRAMLASVVEANGFIVQAVATAQEFLRQLEEFEPHAVVVDLDLGAGPSGIELLALVHHRSPWVGRVVVTNYRSPQMVETEVDEDLFDEVAYIVKSDVEVGDQVIAGIEASLQGERFELNHSGAAYRLSKKQAELLAMVAKGMTNDEIAQSRGVSRRAIEQLLRRTYVALGLSEEDGGELRVTAAAMFDSGDVTVVASPPG